MDPELLRSIIPKLRKLGFSGISITGGEPILHPRFNELVNTIVSEGFLLGIVTNGIQYKEYLHALEPHKKRVSFVAVSLDSHKEETNDYIRGKGSFVGAVNAVKALREKHFFIKVSHVVNKKNLKDLLPFIPFVLDLGSNAVNVLGTIRTPENKGLVLDENDKQEFHAMLNILRVLYPNKVFCASSTGYSKRPLFCDNFNNMNDMTLDFEGNLIFCCDTIYRGAVLGNLETERFENLVTKYMETQHRLRTERIKALMDSKSSETNDCNFCNRILRQMIRS